MEMVRLKCGFPNGIVIRAINSKRVTHIFMWMRIFRTLKMEKHGGLLAFMYLGLCLDILIKLQALLRRNEVGFDQKDKWLSFNLF
ncbi:hypothetical protein EPI10_005886 [Gossypium australe]|uniref:Uncharacterized protein n=1 Tax=Gossypium australe TaxID=47621 RepID=A0A5B6WQV6_9ROSI|nr:hypothetical protein EPI10_005886 [Gossypium australe]